MSYQTERCRAQALHKNSPFLIDMGETFMLLTQHQM
jgi:hypothetical protein